MMSLPLGARLYISTIVSLGAGLLVLFFPVDGLREPALFVVLLVVSSLTSIFKVGLPLSKGGSSMSVSYAIDFAALLALGPAEAMLIAAASAWSQCTFRMKERNPVHQTLFSMAALVITVQAAGRVYQSMGGQPGSFGLEMFGPVAGSATAYFILNTVTVAAAIGLSTGQPLAQVWHNTFLWSAPSYLVGALVGVAAAYVMSNSYLGLVPLGAAPLLLTYRAYSGYLGRLEEEQRQVKEMSDLHLATVEALARAIDAKDQISQGHLRRVQFYGAALARASGMSEAEVQGVKTAALLHDIGKLAVPEQILSKPGPLTPEEFQKIRIHPKVGADIIKDVPFPYPVGPLILGHHERWDGRGYPSGLKGEDIPLGARILAVVDYFDAIMTERPYHKAGTFEKALRALQDEAGRGLDPQLVQRFVELLPVLNATAHPSEIVIPQVERFEETPTFERHPVAGAAEHETSVFVDIAMAHREIYALYEIAQTMGTSLGVSDTMVLIASKLRNLVPFSACALLLHEEESDTLRCRFATGTDAETLRQIVLHNGDGLSGAVSGDRGPLLNGRPGADLEAAGLVSASTTLRSALVCPLVFGERFIGTLAVYHEHEDFFTEDHRRLLIRVAEQAAAVINNSMVFEQTQEDSLTDPLTGLPNTRFLFMHLTRELARSERINAPVSLLVMDLDNFKDINDTHGHHVGDRTLCEVGAALRNAIRPYDVCVRYAGDEFILVLSGCGPDEVEHKREELQRAVEDLYFEARPGKRIHLSASIGAAVFPDDGCAYEALMAAADSRMYQDKAARKRRSRNTGASVAKQAAAV